MKKWLEGPEFLTKPRTEWPTNTLSNLTPPEQFISAKEQTICSALESRFTGELNSIDKKGLVRVAQVKARNTVLTRPVTKLCMIEETAQ